MGPASGDALPHKFLTSARLLAGTAVLLVLLVYANALDNPFIYDDFSTILTNPSLLDLRDLRAILLHDAKRPVVNASYALDHAIWGPRPFGFHLTSVLLHVLNVLLLFRLARHAARDWNHGSPRAATRLDPELVAAGAAALFAVHPMLTQAVGYVSARSELLCGTFFLAGCLAARRWMIGGTARWLGAALGLWVLALASKETAFMWPVVVLCYDRLVVGGEPAAARRRLRRVYLPLIGLALTAGAVRFAVLTLVEYPQHGGEVAYVLVALDVIRRYLQLLVVPLGQSLFHGVTRIDTVFSSAAVLAVGPLACVVALAVAVRRANGLVTAGLSWVLLLVPISTLLVLDIGEPMAEHRVYVASGGIFLAAGAGLAWAWARLAGSPAGRRRLRIAVVTWLAVLGALAFLRNARWSDPVLVWLEATRRAPDLWAPQMMLGQALQRQGAYDLAVLRYERAIALAPEQPVPYMLLGASLLEVNLVDEARQAFETLRRLQPDSPVAPNGLGVAALLGGDVEEARRWFECALTLDPGDPAAAAWLGQLETLDGAELSVSTTPPAGRTCPALTSSP